MENPNLNEIVLEKLNVVKDRLQILRNGLSDRWIATDSHFYQRIEDAIRNVEGLFFMSLESAQKAEEEYKIAQESYLASIVEVKEVKHPKTGETVKLRVQKRPPRMAPSRREELVYGSETGDSPTPYLDIGPWVEHTNEELLAEQVKAEAKNGTLHTPKGFVSNPFVSDGLGAVSVQIVKD